MNPEDGSIQDILIFFIAPELHRFLQSKLGPGARLEAPAGAMEDIVSFVLDAIPPASAAELAALKKVRAN